MSTPGAEVADGLAGPVVFQAWLQEMLGDLMPGDEEPDERRRVLLGLHAALDVFTWKLLRRDLGLSPRGDRAADDRPRAGRARPAPELTMARFTLFTQWDGGGSLPPELTVVRRLVEAGHAVTVLGDPVTEPEVRAVGVTDFRPWVDAPHHVTRRAEDDYIRDWEVRNPMSVLGNLMDTLMVPPAPLFAAETLAVIDDVRPDVVASSFTLLGALMAAEARARAVRGARAQRRRAARRGDAAVRDRVPASRRDRSGEHATGP